MFGVLVFEDNHTEDIIVYRPNENGQHEIFTHSGLYIYVENEFYKYDPKCLVRYPRMSGGCDYSDRNCYFVDKTVSHVKLNFPQTTDMTKGSGDN